MGDWKYQHSLEELSDSLHPDAESAQDLVRQVQSRRSRPSRAAVGWVAGGLLAAAAALVAVSLSGAGPRNLEQSGHVEVGAGITLAWDGAGVVDELAPDDVRIDWNEGRIDVAVPHGQGIDLAVHTPEGSVHVVGTRFSVERDALGTHVSVEKGKVRVDCDGEDSVSVTGGSAYLCLRSAEAGLQQVRDLQQQGAAAEEVLGAIERAQRLDGVADLTARELDYLRVMELESSDPSAALAAAEALIVSDSTHRRLDMHRVAARVASASQDCERAAPHLEALVSAGDAIAHVLLSDCLVSSEPERARQLLLDAQALDGDLPGVQARLDRLD